MRKAYQLLLTGFLCLIATVAINAQTGKPNAANGGVFTPKGTLRALIVFVTFKDEMPANPNFKNAANDLPQWKAKNASSLPDFVDPVTGDCPDYIFNKESDFETYMNTPGNNYSKELYWMSQGKFKLIGEVFKNAKGKPTVVELDPSSAYSWMSMNQKAFEKMKEINPNFDYARFDLRQNSPNFLFDNSDTINHKPDKILDFVVFIHRYSKGWKQHPTNGMKGWVGSGGGFAGTGIGNNIKSNGYRIDDGFTMTYNSGVFIHEVAHVLFNAPHIMGVNNVIGDYFYLLNAGWGIMAPISIFGGFNAWERWYCGFIEPKTYRYDKTQSNDITFELEDYMATGDAARIEIPFSGGQSLWLENHTKIHPLDEHPWAGNGLGHGDFLGPSAKGVYAYVEAIANERTQIFSALSNKANGIKVLHAGGNYDYHLYEEIPDIKNAWGNPLKSFKKGEANAIAGLNNFYRYPFDTNKDGKIHLDKNYNSSKTEWMAPVLREEVREGEFVNTYGGFGVYDESKMNGYLSKVPFDAGDYLDMSSNPMPLNYPMYNMAQAELKPYYLNGLGIKFLKGTKENSIKVQVRYKMTQLCQNTRWCGNIVLPNISEDDNADLIVGPCAELVVNKSGTPNTHLLTKEGDFILPSKFTVQQDAVLRIAAESKMIFEQNAQLIIEKGGKVIIEKGGQLIFKSNSTLVGDKAAILVKSGGSIIQ